MKRPRPVLLIALLATGVATLVVELGGGDGDVVRPVAQGAAAAVRVAHARPSSPVADLSLRLATRPQPNPGPRDLFAAYSWLPPPPPPPVPASLTPAPPPAAPPLPVRFGGVLQFGDQDLFLLIDGEHTYPVPLGGQVGEFQLQSAAPFELVFLHAPTGLTRTLAISAPPLALLR